MKQLIAYLLENLILDFQGDLTLDMVRDFLRDDESREGRALLSKLVEDRGVSDMMITLEDPALRAPGHQRLARALARRRTGYDSA